MFTKGLLSKSKFDVSGLEKALNRLTKNSVCLASRQKATLEIKGHFKKTFCCKALRYSSTLSVTSTAPLSVILGNEENNNDMAKNFFPTRIQTSGLKELFEPKSVAVIGATGRIGSVGRTIVANLLASKTQTNASYKIFPVNPSRDQVLGLPCYSSVKTIPDEIDLVVIVTPAKSCVEMMRQCAEKKVKAAVVISAGFREAGKEGVQLENDLISIARDNDIRVVGPNCLGVMNPVYGLNATFASTMGTPGRVAFISQSGAMCTSVLDWSLKENIGFSAFVSVGGMADVNWGDLLDYLGDDPNTSAILMYMEGAGDAEALLAAAKEVAMKKPIIAIKAGKSGAAAAAAASHTGSLAGSYKSFEAAMQRAGVMTVDNIQQLFDCALLLGKQPRPQGSNLLIVTNAGGPAVLAVDAIVSSGAHPAPLSDGLKQKLDSFLPEAWSRSNPIDIIGDASPERFQKTLETVLMHEDKETSPDGVLVILSPQDSTDPTKSAECLVQAVQHAKSLGKCNIPILAAWMGGATVEQGSVILSKAGIPSFSNPDDAASTFGKLWKHAEQLDVLYNTALNKEIEPRTKNAEFDKRNEAIALLREVKKSNRSILTEAESKKILSCYGISVVPTIIATSESEAITAARSMGYEKFAVKLHSETLTHKADVGGVKLNVLLQDVGNAFKSIQQNIKSTHGLHNFQGVTVQPMIPLDQGIELILGSTVDPQFGPLIMFGSGGSMVEIFKDTALGVPPLTTNLSDKLLKSTRIYKALKGAQGKRFEGVNLDILRKILNQFSQMILDISPYISECDINPLLAMKNQEFIALDARFILGTVTTPPVVRPYPKEYETTLQTLKGVELYMRPALPCDMGPIQTMVCNLTEEDARNRFLKSKPSEKRITTGVLTNICFGDYDRMLTLVAFDSTTNELKGFCEIQRSPKTHLQTFPAHIRLTVDESRNPGLTLSMLNACLRIAKKEKIENIVTYRLASDKQFSEIVSNATKALQAIDIKHVSCKDVEEENTKISVYTFHL
ncbi:peptidyl-lysine N-acetyltransferase PatZ-like [Hylaeus volcanicus]|uniref:peptidyl-lysine N-acetyltransferase PatZ-like n=1 Tax=Hylaeus volcanicus TaxID=313075 RepID=UPI0023B7A52D|nr:peptidyl-lysine N-acetyltransferase PatZ-like [Hylaeus volcanicus]